MCRMPCLMLAMSALLVAPSGMQAAEPQEPTALLQKNVGTWDGALKLWVAGPSDEPVSGRVVETTRSLRDGLWITSAFTIDVAGLTIEGAAQIGFDGRKKKFVGSMIESSSSQLAIYEGDHDAKSHTTVLTAVVYDPLFTKTVVRKLETKFESADRRTVTLFIAPAGADKPEDLKFVKVIETIYTRRPEATVK